MKPLNQSERQKAFWRFLMFFVVTVGVILTTVFFSVAVPFKQNDELTRQMDAMETERDFLATFENKVQETANLIDTVNMVKYPMSVDADINKNIDDMYRMVKDSLSVKNLCIIILDNLTNLHEAKKAQRTGDLKDQTIENNAKILQSYKDALKDCQDKLDRVRTN